MSVFAFSQDYVDIAKTNLEKYKGLVKNRTYVIVIDYSKAITSDRLYIINVKTNKIVFVSTVAHAYNSGLFYATKFSNTPGSNMSCIGAFVTEGEYNGSFGRSMVIKGLEKQNSNAKSRSIIFHSDTKMKTKWSKGCFATPEKANSTIINLTKGGCLVYVFN